MRAELVREQLQALLEHIRGGGDHLHPLDRLHLARATPTRSDVAHLEEGLLGEIGVVRSVTSLEDALQLISEETEEAEEA